MPPFYAEALAANGGDPSDSPMPKWSPELALEFMDAHDIATGILSLSSLSVVGWEAAERRQMARRVNEYVTDLVATRPDRFGNFATVPLPDIEGTLEELRYAFDALRVDGVLVLANYQGRYLGDPIFEPLWAELNRRQAVVLIHPGVTPGQPPFPTYFHPLVTLSNLEAFANAHGLEVIYRKEYESPRFPEMRTRKPALAALLDAAAVVMNLLLPGKLDVRRGDYHVILRKR